MKAINSEQIKCCMCEQIINNDILLVPSDCLIKYGKIAHRICSECWWSKFAIEDISHKCPGCIKGLLLTKYKKEIITFIDLSEE